MNENPQMTSLAMSVFNTIYGWFVEHGYRPYITIVDMAAEGLVVPKVHANFGFPRASTNQPAKPQPKKPTLTVIK